jgi:predicted phage tail protein
MNESISAERAINIIANMPVAPVLAAPANSLLLSDNTPVFTWNAAANAATYQIQIDTVNTFTSPDRDETVGALTYTPATNLPDGVYYWRVRGINVNPENGPFSAVRTFTLDATAPAAPVLNAFGSASVGNPTFTWASVPTAVQYEFQIDVEGGGFVSPALHSSGWISPASYRPSPLVFSQIGDLHWQVRARDNAGNMSLWSSMGTVTVTPPVPVAPMLSAPAANAATTDNTPTFTWTAVPYATSYRIEIDNNNNFSSPEFTASLSGFSQTASLLPNGTYYWRVRANNSLAQPGAWAATRTLRIVP